MVYLISRLPPGGSPLRIRWIEFLLHHFNICGVEKIHRVFVCAIGGAVNDARDASIDQHLRAVDARQMGDITGGAFGGDSMQRSLDDGICFRVDRTDAVSIHHEVPDLVAVILSSG